MKDIEIVEELIKKIEAGGIGPWSPEWYQAGNGRNYATGHVFTGFNRVLVGCSKYASPFWMTVNQARVKGIFVKAGEKGRHLLRPHIIKTKEKDSKGNVVEKSKLIGFLDYVVFNLEQYNHNLADSVVFPQVKREFTPVEAGEKLISGMPNRPTMEEGDMAYYVPSTDTVVLPKREAFKNDAAFYSTAFHELAHSTGHEKRLKRELKGMGKEEYSKEELVAELTSAFLCGEAGLIDSTIGKSAAYINGWLNKLRENPKILLIAAGQAQKAADHISNKNAFQKLEDVLNG